MRSEGVRGDKEDQGLRETKEVGKATDDFRKDVSVSPPGQGPRPRWSIAFVPVQLYKVSARAMGQLSDLLGPPPCLPVAAALENQGPGREQWVDHNPHPPHLWPGPETSPLAITSFPPLPLVPT